MLLASDAVHYYEELERELPFEIYTDLDEMIAGYALLRELAASTGAVLVPGHDPHVTERFPPVSPALAGVALRLDRSDSGPDRLYERLDVKGAAFRAREAGAP